MITNRSKNIGSLLCQALAPLFSGNSSRTYRTVVTITQPFWKQNIRQASTGTENMLCYKTKNDAVHYFFHPSLGDFHHSQNKVQTLLLPRNYTFCLIFKHIPYVLDILKVPVTTVLSLSSKPTLLYIWLCDAETGTSWIAFLHSYSLPIFDRWRLLEKEKRKYSYLLAVCFLFTSCYCV